MKRLLTKSRPSLSRRVLILAVLSGCLAACAVTGETEAPLDRMSRALDLVDQGTIALRNGYLERAWGAFSVAHEIYPTPQSLDGMGCVSFVRGNYLQAERFFVKAYQMDNTYGEALGNLALMYEELGFSAEAEKLYTTGLKQSPEDYRTRANFGVFLANDNRLEEGRVEMIKAKALADDPLIAKNIDKLMPNR